MNALPLLFALLGLPPAADPLAYAERTFPGHRQCQRLLCFNADYRGRLETKRTTFPVHYWAITADLAEAQRRHDIWDALEDAQSPYLDRGRRLERLAEFRRLIGDDAWQAGVVPLHVPLEAFELVGR